MAMTKQAGAIGGGLHRWVRATDERVGLRRVRATIRQRQNYRSTI
jgi:hypothetical protein